MIHRLCYFYRHPDPIYFSVEKLFTELGRQIAKKYDKEFIVEQRTLPYSSNWKRLIPNIDFAKRHQQEINHITGDVHYALMRFSKSNINVLTIHDCVMLHRYSKRNPRYWIMKWLWYDLPVAKADAVTVISEHTKKELLHFTNCDPGKIRVIPNFVDAGFRSVAFGFNKECPCILFVGSTPNKNLERLIQAIEGIKLRLEIIGQLSDDQLALLKRCGIDYHQSSGLDAGSSAGKIYSMRCAGLSFHL